MMPAFNEERTLEIILDHVLDRPEVGEMVENYLQRPLFVEGGHHHRKNGFSAQRAFTLMRTSRSRPVGRRKLLQSSSRALKRTRGSWRPGARQAGDQPSLARSPKKNYLFPR